MSSPTPQRAPRRRRLLLGALALVVWAVVALPTAALTFVHSSRDTVVAGHEAVVSPTLDGWAVVDLGPFLPALRYPAGGPVGARVELGKTPLTSYEALGQRYATIAAQPEGQIIKVSGLVRQMMADSLLVGGAAGILPIGVWLLLGPRRRRELLASRQRVVLVTGGTVAVAAAVALVLLRPWHTDPDATVASSWSPLAEVLPTGITVPEQAEALEVEAGLVSGSTRRLVESAVTSYRTSLRFYGQAAEAVSVDPAVSDRIRTPQEGETVAVLVSDRHDNVGMDPVARAVADAAGASVLFDAGDDTSTGSPWEAFSLESLHRAFADFDARFVATGNHDNGSFLPRQAADLGFTVLDAEVVSGPDDIRLLGVGDPRSSGLGNWRDETGLSFTEVADRLADTACAAQEAGDRISTVLVHDANLGRVALERGCTDLVLGGHLHVVVGPTEVVGENGEVGHSYTTGTTGGAAYAVALGTKPRRDATVSLVTYANGRPVGIQSVSLSPLGTWTVADYAPLDRTAVVPAAAGTPRPADERRAGRSGGGGGI